MKTQIVKFMIQNQYLKKNAMLNATVGAYGLGAQPVLIPIDLLFDSHVSKKNKIVIKGCDPANLREYLVTPDRIHEINGMDQSTIERLFPEIMQ
jgi:hypothetical protein